MTFSAPLRPLLAAVLGTAALALPACGGGGDDGENVIAPPRNTAPTAPTTTPTTPTTTQPQAGQPSQSEQPGSESGGGGQQGAGGGGGGSNDPYQGGVDPNSGSTPGERFEAYCRQNPSACGD